MEGQELATAVAEPMSARLWNMLQALAGMIARTFELHPWMWAVVVIVVIALFLPRRRTRR